ncbi:PfkB family carbohydrate kinase [Roseomonas sp. 18066]|uniref:PfkB family carbohydrate kinase n=1 Tax=Roseomonas sp. 18066 TaxID=2681412 RepID=UPI0013577D53|nr:PfkB family carbohydrate kinase [Roseomonas sp. 18066]
MLPPKTAPRIICLGHATLDRSYVIERFPPGPRKVKAVAAFANGGGMASSAAVAASRLGARVSLWGRVGDDAAGAEIRASLAGEGVATDGLRCVAGAVSATSAVIIDAAGERLLAHHDGDRLDADPGSLPVDQVSRADAVLADLRWIEGAMVLFAAARAAGVPTILDADVSDIPDLRPLLALTDYAMFSEGGLAEFRDAPLKEALAAVRAAGPRHAGVTRGAAGYFWQEGEGPVRHQPGFPVAVVDTNGAGDAFHGGFAWALAGGLEAARAIRLASAAAALKCRKPGARAGLPRQSELAAFLEDAGLDA